MTKEVLLGLIGACCVLGSDVDAMFGATGDASVNANNMAQKKLAEKRVAAQQTLENANEDAREAIKMGKYSLRHSPVPAERVGIDYTVVTQYRVDQLRKNGGGVDAKTQEIVNRCANAMENLNALYQLTNDPHYKEAIDNVWWAGDAQLALARQHGE